MVFGLVWAINNCSSIRLGAMNTFFALQLKRKHAGVGGMPITAPASRSEFDKIGGAEILFDKMSTNLCNQQLCSKAYWPSPQPFSI